VLGVLYEVLFGLLKALRLAAAGLVYSLLGGVLVGVAPAADRARLRSRGVDFAILAPVVLLVLGHVRRVAGIGGFETRAPGYPPTMLIAGIVAVCLLLLVLGFLVPRLSRGPQRGVDSTLGVGQRAGGKAPGPIGKLFSKSFGSSRRATNKSAGAGRKGRGKLPL
jgi:Family of unknown function (DUF6411)